MNKFLLSILTATALMAATATSMAQSAPTTTPPSSAALGPVVCNAFVNIEGGTFSIVDEREFNNWGEAIAFVNDFNEAAFGTGFLGACWQIPNVMLSPGDAT